jgi:hypothetical protein
VKRSAYNNKILGAISPGKVREVISIPEMNLIAALVNPQNIQFYKVSNQKDSLLVKTIKLKTDIPT